MLTIRFQTTLYRPDLQVTLRSNVDGWEQDVPGRYAEDSWVFKLDDAKYGGGSEFKLVLESVYWMLGPNRAFPAAGTELVLSEADVQFPPANQVAVENSGFQQQFFRPALDESVVYDVIVVGTGIGGGVVADQLADLGANVLVLEAGSLLFTTHAGNLPRRQRPGEFDKHVWALFGRYKLENFENEPGTDFQGGQVFNLGGRSLFWGGLIPRMTWWELDSWPTAIRWYLEETGYQQAEDLTYWPAPPSMFQTNVRRRLLPDLLPDHNHFDAPVAVRDVNPSHGTMSAGLFSTADLLTESRLTQGQGGDQGLSINLNHAVVALETENDKVTHVVAYDLLVRKYRKFRAKYVILSAGTIESAKIAQMSKLRDPNGLVGTGFTDHPIFFTHFVIPEGARYHTLDSSSKTLSRHREASGTAHPYNMVLEIGADLNQGRYIDDAILERHIREKKNATICEIVFLFNSPLINGNTVRQNGPSHAKPRISMQPSLSAEPFVAEAEQIKTKVLEAIGAQALPREDLRLQRAMLGGACHEVGTLRLGPGSTGVVDENLKWNGYDNLFVCDLSVFPSSPAANPTLTLAALALRLARHVAKMS